MDLKGSLVNTNIKIFPSKEMKKFINNIPLTAEIPTNIINLIKNERTNMEKNFVHAKEVYLNENDLKNLSKIQDTLNKIHKCENTKLTENPVTSNILDDQADNLENSESNGVVANSTESLFITKRKETKFLCTSDLDWIYAYIKKRRQEGDKSLPFFHVLFEGSQIELPENDIIKRNPVLEARCVKLRAQQEVREYRKMTKSVDNVRIRYPEDSISYQMKQLNRQLIAIGQFIISIFAGFLFGFRGVELMIGNLDFGFRLLLGVMCALVIALAEIYFLAKKLNEELNVPETVQLGGPPKFVNEPYFVHKQSSIENKQHQD